MVAMPDNLLRTEINEQTAQANKILGRFETSSDNQQPLSLNELTSAKINIDSIFTRIYTKLIEKIPNEAK